MKNIFKKITCFILILSMLSTSYVFATDGYKKYEELDNDVDFLKLLSSFLDVYYLYDIPQEDVINALYKGFLELAHEKSDKDIVLDVEKLSTQIDTLNALIKQTLTERGISVTNDEIATCLYKSLFSVLDPYSVYFTDGEYNNFSSSLSGETSGIGVQITQLDQELIITYIFPDSPAEKAGIAIGDKIIAVDNVNVEKMELNSASSLIRGEVGTKVSVTISRNGKQISYNMTRDLFTINSAEGKVLDNNIGYLAIQDFNDNTAEQVEKILAGFDAKKITKVIVDVRDNPGGYIHTVLDILNLFVEAGPVLYTKDSLTGEECYKSELEKQKYELCVLVNGNSASASEIFAGAVQDRKAGKIIGTTTYGKGVVQSLYKLTNGDAVKITTAEYFTPNKNKVQGVGITPDIIVENKSSFDLSSFPIFNKSRKPVLNTVGLDVLRAEMILKLIGYDVNEPDGILDIKTEQAIKKYQSDTKLYAYGVLDFATQDALDYSLDSFIAKGTPDYQLEAAIKEILK